MMSLLLQLQARKQNPIYGKMVPDAHLAEILSPFPCSALGWFCLGYHTHASPGRAAAIASLLASADLLPHNASATTVAHVLARLLAAAPNVLTLRPRSIATYTPVLAADQPVALLNITEFVPCSGGSTCTCGRSLVLWKQTDAFCFTFARGLVRAKVLFLRCFSCSAVYGPILRYRLALDSNVMVRKVLHKFHFKHSPVAAFIFPFFWPEKTKAGPGDGMMCRKAAAFLMASTARAMFNQIMLTHGGSLQLQPCAGRYTSCGSSSAAWRVVA